MRTDVRKKKSCLTVVLPCLTSTIVVMFFTFSQMAGAHVNNSPPIHKSDKS